jgi:hypothetical protein
MAINFVNLVKGQITQAVVSVLFEQWRYRVSRLGIEEVFGEVKHVDLAQYRRLNLPIQLRMLPDLLVASIDMTEAFLVEVKFRKELDEETANGLHAALTEQRRHWPQSYALLIIAEPFTKGGRFHQDYMRVVLPDGSVRQDAHICFRQPPSLIAPREPFARSAATPPRPAFLPPRILLF